MKDNNVIALSCSGGIDSTALIGYILSNGDTPFIIHIDYGAANNFAEANHLDRIYKWYDDRAYTLRRLALSIDNMVMFAEQVSKDIPAETFADMKVNETIFPGRNALLISMVSAAALARNIIYMYAGMAAHDEEANFPDCSHEFLLLLKDALYEGYRMHFVTPFWHRSRADVIKEAYKYKVPLHLTYSCYRGGPTHCGRCPACYSRMDAFAGAGFDDPTTYATPHTQVKPDLEVWNVQDW